MENFNISQMIDDKTLISEDSLGFYQNCLSKQGEDRLAYILNTLTNAKSWTSLLNQLTKDFKEAHIVLLETGLLILKDNVCSTKYALTNGISNLDDLLVDSFLVLPVYKNTYEVLMLFLQKYELIALKNDSKSFIVEDRFINFLRLLGIITDCETINSISIFELTAFGRTFLSRFFSKYDSKVVSELPTGNTYNIENLIIPLGDVSGILAVSSDIKDSHFKSNSDNSSFKLPAGVKR